YARVSLGSEPEKLADFYDTSFLAAGPKGGATFKNDESFLAWLRGLRAVNVKSGVISMAVDETGAGPGRRRVRAGDADVGRNLSADRGYPDPFQHLLPSPRVRGEP